MQMTMQMSTRGVTGKKKVQIKPSERIQSFLEKITEHFKL